MDADDNKKTATKSSGFLTLPMMRDAAILCFVLLAFYKLAVSNISIDLKDFSFNDLLALILALFSMWLSTAFYFKANETANQFYHNTFDFTKQTSEILGRIESGFGEKFNSISHSIAAIQQAKDNVESAKSEIASTDAEGSKIIAQLMEKANLDEKAKIEMKAHLETLQEERDRAIKTLHSSIEAFEPIYSSTIEPTQSTKFIISKIRGKIFGFAQNTNPDSIRKYAPLLFKQLPTAEAFILLREGVFRHDGEVTQKGIKLISARNTFPDPQTKSFDPIDMAPKP